ncbi:TKL family protein kinase [Tritrichomonas foetus]|uniref:TKL family protein kinase n=1 Tax=Tritrichomonas foetus TaxID=1144522 RepID=A0A1J4KQU5_9EUKA|nr:TKL family protein kinase [Tritrichomonas foetus]|eukprot:OHT13627.1 TKL family protein kinase [Tritrichomonas foetus]
MYVPFSVYFQNFSLLIVLNCFPSKVKKSELFFIFRSFQMSDFFGKLSPILTALQNLQRSQFTVYIHCSKLNSLLQALKEIPHCIEIEKNYQIKRSIGFKNRNSINTITNTIEQVQNLASQCLKDSCIHYLLSNPIKTTKREIRSIRETLHSNFESLKLSAVAALFKLPRDDLDSQDLVDMKRISQILTQVSQKTKDDTTEKIAQRFKSLKKLGINAEPMNEKPGMTSVIIPEIPSNLHLVINHDDVQIMKEIGTGQSGSVHLGMKDGKEVAVKVLYKRLLTPPELESFRREIYALSVLDFPTLLKFYGYTVDPPFLIVTEYMSNGSVFNVLRKTPEKLTPTKRSLVALDVARGLDFLHQRNIIHRDLKSLNVLLDDNYRAKICDFGMVRFKDDSPKTGLIGTAHWMAPEVLMSSPTYDNKVDVYSFGIFLWELLTGDMPYKDLKTAEIITRVSDGQRPPLGDNVPPKLRDLITRCWDQEPKNRPTITKILIALEDPGTHFVGTDEAEFMSSAGIVQCRHKSSISMPYEIRAHKRRIPVRNQQSYSMTNGGEPFPDLSNFDQVTGMDILDTATLVEILIGTDKTTQNEVFERLFSIIGEKSSEAEAAAKAGFSTVVATVLDQKDQSSDFILSKLLKCKATSVFDINVLKSLLAYSTVEDEGLRSKALGVLIVASGLQFDFLKRSPSFILQLLKFLCMPLAPQLCNSLLQLSKQLLSATSAYPGGALQILFQAKNQLNEQLKPAVISCIVSTLRFNDARNQITRDMLIDAIKDINSSLIILEAYASENDEKTANDLLFISLLFAARTNDTAFELLVKTAHKPRFVYEIIELLPLGLKPSVSSRLYQPIMSFKEFLPRLRNIPEFYNVLSYWIENKEYELVCSVLRSVDIVTPDAVRQSILCLDIVEAFNSSNNESDQIMLMGCVYSLAKDETYYSEFDQLFPKIWNIMMNGDPSLRLPSFLSIAAIARTTTLSEINIPQLVILSAEFVSCNSTMTREVAMRVLRKHIKDKDVDLNEVLAMFLNNHENYNDKIERRTIKAFKSACRSNPSFDHALKKKLDQLPAAEKK